MGKAMRVWRWGWGNRGIFLPSSQYYCELVDKTAFLKSLLRNVQVFIGRI